MYKVFFNDSTIQIGGDGKISSKKNIKQVVDCERGDLVNRLVSEIELSDKSINFVILSENLRKLWKNFKSQLIEIPAAGGLVLNTENSLLFIKRFGLWDLPKGKIEKKETPENAAIREVEEECGVSDLKIIQSLDSTFHIFRSAYLNFPENLVLKETKWYLMRCEGEQTLVPQTTEQIEDVKWFSINELDVVMANTYPSLREFLEKALSII